MFYVDGMNYPTFEQAEVVAKRLYKRYDGYRSIQIVDCDGNVYHELEASEDFEEVADDNLDWVGH